MPLSLLSQAAVTAVAEALAADLSAANFTEHALINTFGKTAYQQITQGLQVLAKFALADSNASVALKTMIRTFQLGQCVSAAALNNALPSLGLERGCATGIVSAAWIVERERLEPVAYAAMWVRDGGVLLNTERAAQLIRAYLADFKSRNVVSVLLGTLRLQKNLATAGSNVVRVEAISAPYLHNSGQQLSNILRLVSRLTQLSDHDFTQQRFICNSGLLEQRIHEPGHESASQLNMIVPTPYQRHLQANTLTLAPLGACDEELTIGQISDALAQIFNADAIATRQQIREAVSEYAWRGALSLASTDTDKPGALNLTGTDTDRLGK
ncbi:hypothetical protein KJY77_01710 [Canibacter sp. lx-72]|uniref:DUF7059 domain-containing protein n=1 Tax=Canibacter zhuwentaonis TaxID=2837491 RepID=UPI001BDDA9DB|nr:hypothetical protein [Canibacter zhuwentaonis]MBT1017859.1 hypothetical protein [Canibacter zhuwentaonis]